jgi:quercetin dioxygenase-like cupin family protein
LSSPQQRIRKTHFSQWPWRGIDGAGHDPGMISKAKQRKDKPMSSIQTVETSKTEAIAAPFPNTKGTATIKVLNSDQSFGPAVAILRMEPGSEIARHVHEQTTEMAYVLDGDFINEGISYPKGTEFNIKPNTAHGPHTTKTGCSVLVTFSYPSTFEDFKLA